MTMNRSTRNLTKKHDYFHIYREEWRISSLRNLLLQLLTSILILNWGSAFLQISIFFVSMLLRKLKHMKKCFFLIIIWQCVLNMAPPLVSFAFHTDKPAHSLKWSRFHPLAFHTNKPAHSLKRSRFLPFAFQMCDLHVYVVISTSEALSRPRWRDRWTHWLSCFWNLSRILALHCASFKISG